MSQPESPHPDQTQQPGQTQHLEDATIKLKNLIPPLKDLTASIEAYVGSQIPVSVPDAEVKAAPVASGSAAQEASVKAAPEASVKAAPEASGSDAAGQGASGSDAAGQGAQTEAERLKAQASGSDAAAQGASGSAALVKAAQEASGSDAAGQGASGSDAAGQGAQTEAERLKKEEAERLKTEEDARKKTEEEERLAAEASGSAAQEAADKLAEEERLKKEEEKAAPAFKQPNSNIKFNNSDGKIGTNYFQIMNKKIDKFFKQIDNEIANADPEDKEILRERKVKYERVKQLLQDATTEADVNNIIKDNQVVFDSNSIRSGGTRKHRVQRRKKTQRKRSKTIKKKNRAGKRK
jgi:hypothetical protein